MRGTAAVVLAVAAILVAVPARGQDGPAGPEEAPGKEEPKAAPKEPPAKAEERKGEALEKAVEEAVAGARSGDVAEVTVTATRTRRDPFELPQSISIFDREDLAGPGEFVAMKAASRRDAGIWYDERTGTTTDPIIRGFTGFNLLTLVDGNTLSTLWGEGGFGADDMYGKIDPETVERIEVIRGPSSALHGSNALGAVVNVITRSAPLDFPKEGFEWGARSKASFASAGNSVGIRQELFAATPDLRFLLGGSAREFHDVRGGGDLGLLEPTNGRERNWDFSGEWRVSEDRTLRLTLQDVHRWDIKRYYRPFQNNANDREAVAVFWNDGVKGPLWDELEARLYHQQKRDVRWWFKFDPAAGDWTVDKRGEATTTTWQAGLRGTKDAGGGHTVTAGLSIELDEGDGPDDEQFTYVFPEPRRRDAPLSDWWDYGVFVQDEWRVSRPLSLLASARYDAMTLATDVDSAYRPSIGNPRDDEVTHRSASITGGLGGVWRFTDQVHVMGNWARGFRQNPPNFGIRQLGDGVLIPNGLLDATTSDNFEVGLKTRAKGIRFESAFYWSLIRNWQGDLRPVASHDGAPYADLNGNGVEDTNEGWVEQVEGGDAWVKGIELRLNAQPNAWIDRIPANWSLWGSFAWNKGRSGATSDHPQSEPLRHTQPPRGLLAIRWDEIENPRRGLYAELVADMVGRFDEIPSDRLATDVAWRRDPQDGSSPLVRSWGGVPGYTLFNAYAGLKLSEKATFRLGVENLFNKKYRAAHSRMDAPGASLVGSLEVWF